jgi:trimeric autotransporter adhesin
MFKSAHAISALLVLSAVAAAPSFAQSLVNPVGSDSGGNTAMGTGALVSDDTPNADTHVAVYNTAAGEAALNANTSGYGNSAFGNYALPLNTTGSTNTAIGAGSLGANVSGSANTASGYGALSSNTTGTDNTATGLQALATNTSGGNNTAAGYQALYLNTTGSANTATGEWGLLNNTTGADNTANGYQALLSNTTGGQNTASGANALFSNTTGNRNNASGEGALYTNTTASDNNAMGASALYDNTTGTLNNAVGNFAMEYNTTGSNNNAVGYGAMLRNTTGSDNSAQGYEALATNTTGSLNIAIGYKAGFSQTTGSDNIYIGNTGVAAESHIIRIGASTGTPSQSTVFIAGISGNVQTGGTVVVTSSGQLGVASSSRRYKEDIQPLGDASERLYSLHPVKFRYIKPDEQGEKPVQFGLIAEEVAEVLPEVVYRNAEGKVEGVRYDELTPLLVNEVQERKQQLTEMREQNRAMQMALAELKDKDARVAMQ